MTSLFRKFSEDGWNIAVRSLPTGSILTDRATPFEIIPNSYRTWAADPFLFEYDGVTYIFAEIFDYLNRKGAIGYTCLRNQKWQPWKIIIDEPFHMSYPNIFVHNGEIYMVPETSADRSLRLYKATVFPDKWELHQVIATNVAYVDTTFFNKDGQTMASATDVSDPEHHRDMLLSFGDDLTLIGQTSIAEQQTQFSRCGGNFFSSAQGAIRVSQNCDGHYGKALIFSRFSADTASCGLKEIILEIAPQDLSFSASRNWFGLHTYNSTSHYEVVDIETNHYNPLSFVGRILFKLGLCN